MSARTKIVRIGAVGVGLLTVAGVVWLLGALLEPVTLPETVTSEGLPLPVADQAQPSASPDSLEERSPSQGPREDSPPKETGDGGAEEDTDEPAPEPAEQREEEPPQAEEDSQHELFGRVVDPNGTPVAEARVTPQFQGFIGFRASSRRPLDDSFSTSLVEVSNEEGIFRLPPFSGEMKLERLAIEPPAPYHFVTHSVDAQIPEMSELRDDFDLGRFVVDVGATINGRVTDEDGLGIEGVTILLGEPSTGSARSDTLWPEGPSTTTDASGYYRLAGIQPGSEAVSALAPGYRIASQQNVEFQAGETTHGVDFVLERAAALNVYVTDGTKPLAGAGVQVRSGRRRRPDSPYHAEAQTNEEGRAAFPELLLTSSEVTVRASKVGYDTARARVELLGQGSRVELELTLTRGATVELRPVEAGSGEPILDESVSPSRRDPIFRFPDLDRQDENEVTATVGDDGTLRLEHVPAGQRQLVLAPMTHQPVEKNLSLEPGKTYELGDVPLEAGTEVMLRVLNQQREPVAGARVRADRQGTPRGGSIIRRTIGNRTDEQGRIALGRIGARRLRIQVRHDEYLRHSKTLELQHTEEAVEYEVTLEHAAVITGRVLDQAGEPVARHSITLLRVGESSRHARNHTTDRDGRFTFNNVEPGEGRYLLTANREAMGRGWPSESDRRWFTIERGGTYERDVTIEPSAGSDGELTGVLLFHDGSLASQVSVRIVLRDHRGHTAQLGSLRTDAYGAFAVSHDERLGGTLLLYITPVPGREVTLARRVPGGLDLGEIRLPRLEEEARAALRIKLEDEQGRAVTRTVRLQSRAPVRNESVEWIERRMEVAGEGMLENLPPQRLRLTLAHEGEAQMEQTVQLEAGELSEVTLLVRASTSVTLRVIPAKGETPDPPNNRVIIRTQLQEHGAEGPSVHGRFHDEITLTGLAADEAYRVTVGAFGFASRHIEVTPQLGDRRVIEVKLESR